MTRYNETFIQDEKKWFTQERLKNLSWYDPETRKKILQLEEKFGKLCFCPLDIPPIKDENFSNWYFKNAIPSIKQNKDVATQYTGSSSFLSIDVVPDWHDVSKSIWSKNVKNNIDKLWPSLWDQFYEFLPFDKILGLSIWSSTKDILPHRDQSLFIDLPLEFRVLMDSNPVENLYVSEVLPNSSIDKSIKTTVVPNRLDTNSFVWNNLRTQHHSIFYPEYKKIIFIFHYSNKINWKKYENLIEKSILKFQKYSLVSNSNLSDYININ